MPYSSNNGKALLDRAIPRLRPLLHQSPRILDIGAGSGTYSDRYKNTLLTSPTYTWEAVEIWEPYVAKFKLENKYDIVNVKSGTEFLKQTDQHFGLCFLGDVVEHVTKEESLEMINLALDKCDVVAISIPIIHYPQGEYDGNPHEAHVKDDWSHEEVMSSIPDIAWYGVEGEIGVYFCSRKLAPRVQDLLRPTIGVYAICKNEMKFLERFIDSIKGADSVSIVDTGSTDGTYERFLVEENFILNQLFVSPWRFDDPRNAALSFLPIDLDMVVSIDIDELMQDDWYKVLSDELLGLFRAQGKLPDRINHRFETIWNWDKPEQAPNVSSHWHERVHTRKGYMWKLPVHEVLVKTGTPEVIHWMHHWKMTQKPDTTKARSNYLPLLEQSLKVDGKRWKSWSFYGGELASIGRFDEAIEAYRTGADLQDADKPFLTMQIARTYQAMGKLDLACEFMEEAALKAKSREMDVYTAELYELNSRVEEAKAWILKATNKSFRSSGYSFDPGCWDDSFEARRARILNA